MCGPGRKEGRRGDKPEVPVARIAVCPARWMACVAFASHPGVRQVLEIAGTCSDCNTPVLQRAYTFSMVRGGSRGSGCAPGRRQGATGTTVRRVWKNNGSAVETEPHGETSAIGEEKRLNINELARAALEREREIRAYRAEAADRGQSPGVNAEKQSWRRKRRSGGEDSAENRAILS